MLYKATCYKMMWPGEGSTRCSSCTSRS